MFPPIKNIKYLSEVPLGFCCTLSFSPFNQLGAAGFGFFLEMPDNLLGVCGLLWFQ